MERYLLFAASVAAPLNVVRGRHRCVTPDRREVLPVPSQQDHLPRPGAALKPEPKFAPIGGPSHMTTLTPTTSPPGVRIEATSKAGRRGCRRWPRPTWWTSEWTARSARHLAVRADRVACRRAMRHARIWHPDLAKRLALQPRALRWARRGHLAGGPSSHDLAAEPAKAGPVACDVFAWTSTPPGYRRPNRWADTHSWHQRDWICPHYGGLRKRVVPSHWQRRTMCADFASRGSAQSVHDLASQLPPISPSPAGGQS